MGVGVGLRRLAVRGPSGVSDSEGAVTGVRLELLDEAVRTITQRVNLFDKVLIPRAQANIKRIRIFLADGERAAVVRAKIAKAKRAKELQP